MLGLWAGHELVFRVGHGLGRRVEHSQKVFRAGHELEGE